MDFGAILRRRRSMVHLMLTFRIGRISFAFEKQPPDWSVYLRADSPSILQMEEPDSGC